MIDKQDDAEYDKGNHGKHHAERVVHNETPDAFMVSRPLQDIPDQLVLKKGHGQFHEFNQVVGKQGNIYPCSDMQKHPFPQNVRERNAEQKNGISGKHHVNKRNVPGLDTRIDNRFGDKRQ